MTQLLDTLAPSTSLTPSALHPQQNDGASVDLDLIPHFAHFGSRTYTSAVISYVAIEVEQQANGFGLIHDQTIAEAFGRLVTTIFSASTEGYDFPLTVALYEFLTFTEAYGWQPLFFNVPEMLVSTLRSQGLEVVKQDFQGSEFRYLAYRAPFSQL